MVRKAQQTEDRRLAKRMFVQYARFASRVPESPFAHFRHETLLNGWRSSPQLFGVSLCELMSDHRKRHAALPVPIAMIKMEEAIERMGGLEAEGIFRRSGDQYHIDQMVKRANRGKSFLEYGDVHAVTCLYKFWIRQIPEDSLCGVLHLRLPTNVIPWKSLRNSHDCSRMLSNILWDF
jgi:hypothetical protein